MSEEAKRPTDDLEPKNDAQGGGLRGDPIFGANQLCGGADDDAFTTPSPPVFKKESD